MRYLRIMLRWSLYAALGVPMWLLDGLLSHYVPPLLSFWLSGALLLVVYFVGSLAAVWVYVALKRPFSAGSAVDLSEHN